MHSLSLIRTFQINGQHGRLPRDIAHTTCNTLAITNGVYSSTSGGAAAAPVVAAVASLTAVNVIVCGQPIKANGLRNPLARCSLSRLDMLLQQCCHYQCHWQCGHPNPIFDLHMTNGESAAFFCCCVVHFAANDRQLCCCPLEGESGEGKGVECVAKGSVCG